MGGPHVVFSDVDGTLVHLSNDLEPLGSVSQDGLSFEPSDGGEAFAVRPLPPSSTGVQGYISERTLELVAELRRAGHRFALISGARSTTIFERLPFLPAADAYAAENGGRIFMHAPKGRALTAAPIVEDLEWRAVHVAAGPASQGGLPPERRSGELWDVYRSLQAGGWALDARSYTTSFRIILARSENKTSQDLAALARALPPTLTSSFNLGAADIYPATSGKDMAARHLMRKFGADPSRCASMGDDDNDLQLATAVGHTYIVGFSADSVRKAVEADPDSFTVGATGGFAATEELLASIAVDFGPPLLAGSGLRPRSFLLAAGLAAFTYAFVLQRRRRRRQ